MGEYGHKQPLFPKEIVYVVIAAVILFGAAMIFGPHLLSAINSGANTVANQNPVDPVWVPKAGDTGQLPAAVNKTTPAPKPKQAEKISDNLTIVGNGLKVEMLDDSFVSPSDKMQSGRIYFKEGSPAAHFYIVADRNNAEILKGVVLNFKGTTIRNFTVTVHDYGMSMTVMATISAGESFRRLSSTITATKEILSVGDPEKTVYSGGFGRIEENDLREANQIVGYIYASIPDEKEKLSKAKVLLLIVIIEA